MTIIIDASELGVLTKRTHMVACTSAVIAKNLENTRRQSTKISTKSHANLSSAMEERPALRSHADMLIRCFSWFRALVSVSKAENTNYGQLSMRP
eukprot:603511-Amphidinium_carterae.2